MASDKDAARVTRKLTIIFDYHLYFRTFVFIQFAFHNSFSGQVIYESWTISYYNVLFTVLPPIVMGVFDQYVSARMLDRYPQMYQVGQKGEFVSIDLFTRDCIYM